MPSSNCNRFNAIKLEDVLWGLVIFMLQAEEKSAVWLAYVTLGYFVCEIYLATPQSSTECWRSCEDDGRFMNIVAVPCLLQSATVWSDKLDLLAKCTTLCSFCNMKVVLCSLTAAIVWDRTLRSIDCMLFVLIQFVSVPLLSQNHRGILTRGEFGVMSTGFTIVAFEWIQEWTQWTVVSNPAGTLSHSSVALSGAMGCALTSIFLITHRLPWRVRLVIHIIIPLTVVEANMWMNWDRPTEPMYFPRSIGWLVQFLISMENGYPRYLGLLYWGLVFLVSGIPTKIVLQRRDIPIVVRRKWFHLLAVVLFGPTTHVLPQLQSLSYAIALCVMAVAENLRPDIPLLQSFYLSFIDPAKDNPALIVSHIFLILGCAIPLWMTQWICDDSLCDPFLPQWGVLCLGVGDAVGAVVGSFYGRHRWGQNRRTIEGSVGMWISIVGAGKLIFSAGNWFALTMAATVTTLMEAFTLQMDNLVLPLVGSTMILLYS